METLKRCFIKNPDGSGIMVALGDKVVIRKGFMTWKLFQVGYRKLLKDYDIKDIDKYSVVYHFRITTQGGVQAPLCHPYPVCNSYDNMRKLSFECDMAMAHNGIISLTSDISIHDRNDTMTFIHDYLNDIVNNDHYWSVHSNKIKLVNKLLGHGYPNKLAILNANGYCQLVGSWIKDNGVFYSNASYLDTLKHSSINIGGCMC